MLIISFLANLITETYSNGSNSLILTLQPESMQRSDNMNWMHIDITKIIGPAYEQAGAGTSHQLRCSYSMIWGRTLTVHLLANCTILYLQQVAVWLELIPFPAIRKAPIVGITPMLTSSCDQGGSGYC